MLLILLFMWQEMSQLFLMAQAFCYYFIDCSGHGLLDSYKSLLYMGLFGYLLHYPLRYALQYPVQHLPKAVSFPWWVSTLWANRNLEQKPTFDNIYTVCVTRTTYQPISSGNAALLYIQVFKFQNNCLWIHYHSKSLWSLRFCCCCWKKVYFCSERTH